jgi:hypothetical protein
MKHIWTSVDHQVMIAFAILVPTARSFIFWGEGVFIDIHFYDHLEGVGDLRSAGRLLVCYTFEIHSSLYKSLVVISKGCNLS